MAVIEGIASADATTLAANDTAVVSLLAVGNDMQGGVHWPSIMNSALLMATLNMRGNVPGRISSGCAANGMGG